MRFIYRGWKYLPIMVCSRKRQRKDRHFMSMAFYIWIPMGQDVLTCLRIRWITGKCVIL